MTNSKGEVLIKNNDNSKLREEIEKLLNTGYSERDIILAARSISARMVLMRLENNSCDINKKLEG